MLLNCFLCNFPCTNKTASKSEMLDIVNNCNYCPRTKYGGRLYFQFVCQSTRRRGYPIHYSTSHAKRAILLAVWNGVWCQIHLGVCRMVKLRLTSGVWVQTHLWAWHKILTWLWLEYPSQIPLGGYQTHLPFRSVCLGTLLGESDSDTPSHNHVSDRTRKGYPLTLPCPHPHPGAGQGMPCPTPMLSTRTGYPLPWPRPRHGNPCPTLSWPQPPQPGLRQDTPTRTRTGCLPALAPPLCLAGTRTRYPPPRPPPLAQSGNAMDRIWHGWYASCVFIQEDLLVLTLRCGDWYYEMQYTVILFLVENKLYVDNE